MTRPCIAIIHFTGPPAPGGIEGLIEAQVEALEAGGYDVRVLVGSGGPVAGASLHLVPEIDPSYPAVIAQRAISTSIAPDHPLADRLRRDLADSLQGCVQCWVHNAFTVALNPFLTAALHALVADWPDIRWVGWCEDISGISAFEAGSCLPNPPAAVELVTLSQTRRRDLVLLTGRGADCIAVIPPPLAAGRWLSSDRRLLELFERIDAWNAGVILLAPAKLLPHKNISRALGITAALRACGRRPLLLVTGASSPHEPERSASLARNLAVQAAELGLDREFQVVSDLLGSPLTRSMIRDLMLMADVLFLPSLEEGFGVPLLEAAALRLPILCSDIPVFREVAGSGATYFSTSDSDAAIAGSIAALVEQPVALLRRRAIRSMAVFRRQIAGLLAGPLLAEGVDHGQVGGDRKLPGLNGS